MCPHLSAPRKDALLGFEFYEGQKVTAFVFDLLAFDELLAKVPYPFIHDMAGKTFSNAKRKPLTTEAIRGYRNTA